MPVTGKRPPPLEIRPLGKLMSALGKFPLLPAEVVDHSLRRRAAPTVTPADIARGQAPDGSAIDPFMPGSRFRK